MSGAICTAGSRITLSPPHPPQTMSISPSSLVPHAQGGETGITHPRPWQDLPGVVGLDGLMALGVIGLGIRSRPFAW